MIREDGVVKLMDFGIARIVEEQQEAQHTGFVGTVYYMAPEQLKGGAVIPVADIYSLGVVAYQLLTGEIFQGGMPGPSELVEEIPVSVDEVHRKAVFWKPEGRYKTAGEFVAQLQEALDPQAAETKCNARLVQLEPIVMVALTDKLLEPDEERLIFERGIALGLSV